MYEWIGASVSYRTGHTSLFLTLFSFIYLKLPPPLHSFPFFLFASRFWIQSIRFCLSRLAHSWGVGRSDRLMPFPGVFSAKVSITDKAGFWNFVRRFHFRADNPSPCADRTFSGKPTSSDDQTHWQRLAKPVCWQITQLQAPVEHQLKIGSLH